MNKLLPIAILTLGVVYFYGFNETFDSGSIKGQRVLITGSSSGIGEQLAYEYSKLGAKVFLTARRQDLLKNVAKKCKELGAQQVEFVRSDLGDQKDRDVLIAEVKKRFGGLDQLVLNHAIIFPGLWLGSKENMTTIRTGLDVNFLSYVDLASQSLSMLTESGGRIGVVSSATGKIGVAGSAPYCSNKHAVQGFFAALRQELLLRNTGISVTTCVIGPVDTTIANVSKEEWAKRMNILFSGLNVMGTPQDAAVAIMRGVTNREYEIFFPKIVRITVSIHKIFPSIVENHFAKRFLAAFHLDV